MKLQYYIVVDVVTKRSGGNDGQNKLDKTGPTQVTSFTIHYVYSHRGVPMFLINLLKRALAILIESRALWISRFKWD